MNLDLELIELELRKRTAFDHQCGQKQNDRWDGLTDFVYDYWKWEAVVQAITIGRKGIGQMQLLNINL